VPGGVQGYDRYAYVNNNPVNYVDPSGHKACDSIDQEGRCNEDLFWNWHNNNQLKTSDEGLEFIKKWEGTHITDSLHTLYNDPAGNCTIGYGFLVHIGSCTNGADTSETDYLKGITEDEAEKLLRDTIKEVDKVIQKNVGVPITQQEFDALVSFTYNVGGNGFTTSTLLEELNSGKYDSVPGNLNEWVWAYDSISNTTVKLGGLVTRRQEEGIIYFEWTYP